ncbi:MAG: DUF2325 domain-containing protein [Clostridia bacterium]
MSIAIIGGNDCMVREYKELCKQFKCKAKVFTQCEGIKKQVGSPDLMILFTNTVSHKMVKCALTATKGKCNNVVRCHSSSKAALKEILEQHAC